MKSFIEQFDKKNKLWIYFQSSFDFDIKFNDEQIYIANNKKNNMIKRLITHCLLTFVVKNLNISLIDE